MLRPARHDSLDDLLRAATERDRDLDLALMRVGVLAPVDLTGIKEILTMDRVSLRAGTNPDGHCVISVIRAGAPLGRLLHNGDIELVEAAVAA